MKKHYQTLGLKEGASQKEILEAYKRLTKELNPSNNNNQEFFKEEYKKVQEAYEALYNTSILATENGAKLNTSKSNYDLKTPNVSIENKKNKNMFTYIFNRKRNILTFVVLVFILKLVLHFFLFSEIEEKVNYDKKTYTNIGSLDYYVYNNGSLVKNTSTSPTSFGTFYRQKGTGKVIPLIEIIAAADRANWPLEEYIVEARLSLTTNAPGYFTKKGEQYVFEPGVCKACKPRLFYYPKEIHTQSFKVHLQKIFSNKPYIFLIAICILLFLVILFNDKIKTR